MTNKNEVKVIKIISDMSIVLNIGSNDGIEVNDTFDIMSDSGTDVIDPDTGESLGTLEYIKASVIVTVSYPKMCVCQNKVVNGMTGALTALSEAALAGYRPSLNVDTSQISGGFEDKSDEPIRIGDRAVKTS
ncbi:MAG: hypothetical protein ACI4GX_08080 [Ruminococcus sp.]